MALKHKERNEFGERRKTAAGAKGKLLKQFASAPKADDPEVVARNAERQARSAAREARRAERDRLRQEEQDRRLLEAAALQEAAEAQAKSKTEAHEAAEDARAAAEESHVAHTIADQMARKVERNRRYAARKAKQR